MKDLAYLTLPLPEDAARAKHYGDLERASRLIERYLKDDKTPECMKARLRIEQEVLKRIPGNYPYTEEEALELVRKEIPDFTMEELHEWEDRGAADWIYLNGEVHLQDRFFASMKKVYPGIAARAHEPQDSRKILDEHIRDIKKNGEAVWHVHLRASVKLKDELFHPGHARVWLPVPAECLNMKNIRILGSDPAYKQDSGADSLCRTVLFEEDMTYNHAFAVEYEYDSCVKYTDVQPQGIASCSEPVHFKAPQVTDTPFLRALCEELKGEESDPVRIAKNFYDFCTKNVTYAFMAEYMALGQIPEYCASQLKGDCGVQALLFISLCTLAGIPAHWQSGLYVTPEYAGNHDWAMFWAEPYGWLFADPSFGGSAWRAGNTERHAYYFGNLDPFRMAANNDVQCPFDPDTAELRYDPYDNQNGEIELDGHVFGKGTMEKRCEVLDMKKIK